MTSLSPRSRVWPLRSASGSRLVPSGESLSAVVEDTHVRIADAPCRRIYGEPPLSYVIRTTLPTGSAIMPLSFTYGVKLCRILCRKGLSREDAEDLIQEAHLRLHIYGAAAKIDSEEAFLRHAVTNLAIDRYRHVRPDIRTEVPLDRLDIQSPLAALSPLPETYVEAQQSLSAIIRLLEEVSPRTCEIYLAHRAGYTYDEISGLLKVSHITIKRHIARGLMAIMEYLASHP